MFILTAVTIPPDAVMSTVKPEPGVDVILPTILVTGYADTNEIKDDADPTAKLLSKYHEFPLPDSIVVLGVTPDPMIYCPALIVPVLIPATFSTVCCPVIVTGNASVPSE